MSETNQQTCRPKGDKKAKPAKFEPHGSNVRVETGDRGHKIITPSDFAKQYEVVGKAAQ